MTFRDRSPKLGSGELMTDADRSQRLEPLVGGVATPARQDSFDVRAHASTRLRRCHAFEIVTD